MRVLLFWLDPPLTLVFMARCGFPACGLVSAVGVARGMMWWRASQFLPSEGLRGRLWICWASGFVCTWARSVCIKRGAAVTVTSCVAAATLSFTSTRRTAFTSTRTFATDVLAKLDAETVTV